MRPLFICAPYWMGTFNPERAAAARHTWRLITALSTADSATARMGDLCRALAGQVASARAENKLPVAIVGDCTFSIGMLAGLQREMTDFTVVWYDAHGDFNTHKTTPSGFIGGMPLAMLCGLGEQTIVTRSGATVHPEADIFLTDARDLDPDEAEAVAASGVIHLPDVADLIGYPLPDKPIYIHFDCDVLHLSDLPAVSYPAEGGPTLETVRRSLAYLVDTGRVAAISVTMWNPALDTEDKQAENVVIDLVETITEQL